jgi:hypothetical protein
MLIVDWTRGIPMTKIAGDNIDDFLDNAHKKFGGNGLGDTDYKPPTFKAGSFKDGKLSKLSFDPLQITIDYAEPGGGKPDDVNKAAIKKAADFAEQHETSHKAGYEAAFKKWDPDKVAKDLMGQTFKDQKSALKAIQDKLTELKKALTDACLDLHKKEGLIVAKKNTNGSIDVTMRAAGPGGCR